MSLNFEKLVRYGKSYMDQTVKCEIRIDYWSDLAKIIVIFECKKTKFLNSV